jgi:hypothetical protein
MNRYLRNLSKIEFVLTNACTGSCKHCQMGERPSLCEVIDGEIASGAVRKISDEYSINTVMVFGGEPLLYPDTVEKIMDTARACSISRRQVITNGYFSAERERIREVARRLYSCGVNDLLVSVVAFHQETIPLEVVRIFLTEAVSLGIPTRLQPAYLVSREDGNPYNVRTRKILAELSECGAPVGEGNIVFFEGNARKYLAEYFTKNIPNNPYVEDPRDVRCLSFSPNGDVLSGNIYESDIMEIIEGYKPTGFL